MVDDYSWVFVGEYCYLVFVVLVAAETAATEAVLAPSVEPTSVDTGPVEQAEMDHLTASSSQEKLDDATSESALAGNETDDVGIAIEKKRTAEVTETITVTGMFVDRVSYCWDFFGVK